MDHATRVTGRLAWGLAPACAGLLATVAAGCGSKSATAPLTLPVTSATVQSAVDLFTTGTLHVPPSCGTSPSIDCPGGTAGTPIPVTVTRGATTIAQTAPDVFGYDVDLAIATGSAIPVSYQGVDCTVAVNTAAGASPTVHVAGTATFSSQTPGGSIDRLDLTIALTGLEATDVTFSGGTLCQMANFGGLSFFGGIVTNAFEGVASHLCAGAGGQLTTCS